MWLRLTAANGNTVVVNSDHIIWFSSQPDSDATELRCTLFGGERNVAIIVKDTIDKLLTMLGGTDLVAGQPVEDDNPAYSPSCILGYEFVCNENVAKRHLSGSAELMEQTWNFGSSW